MRLPGISFALCTLLLAIIGSCSRTNAARIHSLQGQLGSPSNNQPHKPDVTSFNEGQFVVDFACDSSAKPEFCDNAIKAIRSACWRIQSQLKFKHPVKAIMAMHKPCGSAALNSTCPEMHGFIAQATSTHFLPIMHKDGQVYDYPSVLVRQLDIVSDDTSFAWPKYDLMIAFNEAYQYYFDEVPPSPKHSYFETVALHELIHGLGFGCGSLVSPLDADGNTSVLPLVVPDHEYMPLGSMPRTIAVPFDMTYDNSTLRYYEFVRLTIFERFLVLASTGNNSTRAAPLPSVPREPAFLDFLAKMQARLEQLVKSRTIRPMSATAAKAASDKLDTTPGRKGAGCQYNSSSIRSQARVRGARIRSASQGAHVCHVHHGHDPKCRPL
ncbi:hypothetical protein BCR44DRAFT_60978 [Catenaria anguillulae PL171]|uniref:Uncharacterized protein n=1 Tax=Catenaria anguillulae PL171 TaxID=765915 RepID=A0A1Y2HWG0_9FUNG|nr:hypothetical protein BCR44DRAFT_60978 [Catenaria anguillulae PL171]